MIINVCKRWVWCGKEYLKARTLYQVHSPVVFRFCEDVLEDTRVYYAFPAIKEWIKMARHARSLRYSRGLFFFRISQWFQADILFLSDESDPTIRQILVLGNTDAQLMQKKDTNLQRDCHPAFGNSDVSLWAGVSVLFYFPDPDAFLRFVHSDSPFQMPERSLYIIDHVASDWTSVQKWEKIKTEASESSFTLHISGVGLVYTNPEVLRKQDFTLIRYRFKPWAFYDFL